MRLAAIAVLCLFVLTGQTMAGQAPRAVPGTMVSLVPLDNYTPTDRFSGFIDRETGGSIVVTQMAKAAFDAYDTDDLARLRPHFAPVGIAIDAAERTTIDGHRAVLLHGHKGKSRIRSLRIWVALIQADQTILLSVQALAAVAPHESAVRAMLASAKVGSLPSIDEQIALLPYRLGVTKPFRPVRTLAGNTLVMTIGDADVVPKLEQPLLVISATFHEQGRTGSPHDVAMATLRLQGRVFKLDKVLSETVSGDPGTETVEIVAEGTHVPTGTAVDAVQWLHLFDHGSLLTLGFARREAWDDVFPRMRVVHDGITLKTH